MQSSLALWLSSLPITAPATLVVVDAVAAILAFVLVFPLRRRKWWAWVAPAIAIGAGAGAATVWYVGDVQNTFGVSPTVVDRIWTAAVFAGILVAIVNIVLAGWLRKMIGVISIAAFVVAGGLAINRDVGEFLTPGQLLGTSSIQPLALPRSSRTPSVSPASLVRNAFDPTLYKTWRAPTTMPTVGTVGRVTIPATVSKFPARSGLVYLPPAALVKNAPALPVVILMSGQPASPASVMDAGRIPATLDALAAKNRGLAPIVVVPDQLGASQANPMCVNSPLGNSATYLLRDVPTWIRTHLNVQIGRMAWTVGGFSQGATCALQFASARPDLFGSFISVSGEAYPTLSSDAQAIRQAFHGSATAYDAAKPASIMRAHGSYTNLTGVFAVGQLDRKYGTIMNTMSTLAQRTGMNVVRYISPGSAHDWTTAANGFARGLQVLYPRLGLSASVPSL